MRIASIIYEQFDRLKMIQEEDIFLFNVVLCFLALLIHSFVCSQLFYGWTSTKLPVSLIWCQLSHMLLNFMTINGQ